MVHPVHRPTHPIQIASAEKSARIIELRKQGYTFTQIGEIVGDHRGNCQRFVAKYLRQITQEPARELLEKELLALNELYEEAMKAVREYVPVIASGVAVHTALLTPEGYPILNPDGEPLTHPLRDYSPMLAGISSCVRILERRQKLLGLEAPTRTLALNQEPSEPIEFRVIDTAADLKELKKKLDEATTAQPAHVDAGSTVEMAFAGDPALPTSVQPRPLIDAD